MRAAAKHRWTTSSRVRARGAAIAEAVIALPILLVVILGAIQFGLIYQAKATLNHAALQAARAGAVDHASPDALRSGLARGLLPLYSPSSSLDAVVSTIARIEADLAASARIRILNPTREAFDDFAETVDGIRELPNDRLHARSTAIGARSGLNVQDANLLRAEITYGYELKVPLVNWFITRTLLIARGSRTPDGFTQQLLRRTRLPISATSTVRMQSPARLSDLIVSRAELPEGRRVDAGALPPPIEDEATETEGGEENPSSEDSGSSLGDGFFGFGEGTGADNGAGGGNNDGDTGGAAPPWLGGEDSGNPQMCETPDGDAPNWPWDPPGDSDLSALTSQPVSLPALSVGNPIHVVTGNKYQREVDLAAPDGGFEFVRHYNSDSVAYRGALGAGWRHSFDVSISRAPQSATLTLVQADGRHILFHASTDNRFIARRARDGYVTQEGQSFVWHLDRDRSLHFDLDGQLQRVRARHVELRLHYGSSARIEAVEDRTGRTLRFAYDVRGRLVRMNTPIGTWRYRYDNSGNLIAAIAPDNTVRRYDYMDRRHRHHLTSISITTLGLPKFGAQRDTIHLGRWAYDERGRAILSTHPNDRDKVSLHYGDGYTDVTDAFGRRTRYITERRHGSAVVTEVVGPGCGPCTRGDTRFEYNARLQITSLQEHKDEETRFVYDDRARLVEIARKRPDAERRWKVRYRYDDDDRLIRVERPSIISEGLHTLEFTRTASGQVTTSTERGFAPLDNDAYAPLERTWRYHYDSHDRLTAIDGPRTDVADTVRIEYDYAGRVQALVSPDGTERRVLDRDALGRPLRIGVTGRPDTEWRYDIAGRIADLIVHAASGPLVTHIDYDLAGRSRLVRYPDGRVEHISRDAAGHVVQRAFEGAAFAQVSTFAPDGLPTGMAMRDAKGATSNPLFYVYDDRRRLIELRDGEGPPLRQFRYRDDDERPDSIIDALGHERSIHYDTLGRIIRLTVPDAGELTFAYTALGALETVVTPNGATTRYEYDDFGRRIRERSPDRGVTTYTYDTADNLIRKADARGAITTFTYSASGLLATATTSDGTTAFAYRHGRLEHIRSQATDESFSHDIDGRMTRHTRTIAGKKYVTEYRYNRLGQLVKQRLPSGNWLAHTYSGNGMRVRTSLVRFGPDTLVAESPHARRSSLRALGDLRFGNGVEQRAEVDSRGRIRARRISGITDIEYEYDAESRLVQRNDSTRPISFEYDAAGRLTAAAGRSSRIRYFYDENGNRLSIEHKHADEEPRRTTYAYARATNRRIDDSDADGVRHDASGHMIAAGDRRYGYDANGRLSRSYVFGALRAEHHYNVWGERVAKTSHSAVGRRTTHFIYEDGRLIAETDPSGNIAREYIYVDHHPVAVLERGQLYWVHTDHIGAPIAVSNQQRRAVWRGAYEPFGRATIDEDPDGDGKRFALNLRLPGQYADEESGTYYNMMRHYDPGAGRYLTPDPLGILAGLNPYAYASNMPTQRFDSLGLYDEMVHYYITYFLGIVAGLPQDIARTIAIAAQYVDENPLTRPIDGLGGNTRALPLYHFVMNQQGPLYGDAMTDPLRRFYNPSSPQLDNLFASTNPERLFELWREVHPERANCASPSIINNARYQLFGEYLHTYEDTFAHRDTKNMPYGVEPNRDNDPIGFIGGHTGLGNPLSVAYQAPDNTFNQDLPNRPSRCDSYWPTPQYGLTKEECDEMGGFYVPAYNGDWQYNELRTLRMQYEVLNLLRENFSEEIEANRALYAENGRQLKTFTWEQLAGAEWNAENPEANARIGVEQSYAQWAANAGLAEAVTILQQVNSMNNTPATRLDALNRWLAANEFRDPDGKLIQIERWNAVVGSAAQARGASLGWIPAASIQGVLLPAD